MIHPVILSGGSGQRLWPISRKFFPKQFNSLNSAQSIFQETILRLSNSWCKPLILCNEDHRFLVAQQLKEINCFCQNIILEPDQRNTAPAITLASLHVNELNPEDLILVLSSDHYIDDNKKFIEMIESSKKYAEDNFLITYGAKTLSPSTHYGYIRRGVSLNSDTWKISEFVEKPSQELATSFHINEEYFWNAGIFLFKASTFIKEINSFSPEIHDYCKRALDNKIIDNDFIRVNKDEFLKCPNVSVDYALMEKTSKGLVVEFDNIWSDLGTWVSLSDLGKKDNNQNVVSGDVVLQNCQNNFIFGDERLIATFGINNLVIIDTADALLVTTKENSSEIKDFISKTNLHNRNEFNEHKKVHRPWGYYVSLSQSEYFQIKRILVNPNAKLSLQKHKYRAEHWVVIKGQAKVTCDNKIFILSENESTFISQGSIHRLENDTNNDLEIIEIQTGSYLGEDDIERFEDEYHRV